MIILLTLAEFSKKNTHTNRLSERLSMKSAQLVGVLFFVAAVAEDYFDQSDDEWQEGAQRGDAQAPSAPEVSR